MILSITTGTHRQLDNAILARLAVLAALLQAEQARVGWLHLGLTVGEFRTYVAETGVVIGVWALRVCCN